MSLQTYAQQPVYRPAGATRETALAPAGRVRSRSFADDLAASRSRPAYLPPARTRHAQADTDALVAPAKAAPAAAPHQHTEAASDGKVLALATAGMAGEASGKQRRAKHENENAEPETDAVPKPVTGPVELDQDALQLTDAAAVFDGPADLGFRPDRPPAAKPERPTPDVASYLTVFAGAAQAARRLHDQLIEDAHRASGMAAAAAQTRAGARQSELGAGLTRLDDALDRALGDLDTRTKDALRLLDERAEGGRALIQQAALHAFGTLNAATGRVNAAKASAEGRKNSVTGEAVGYRTKLAVAGLLSTSALTRIGNKPEQFYPDASEPMAAATQEAIVTRVPKRAQHRLEAYGKELKAQSAAMAFSFDSLPGEFTSAFTEVAQWIKQTAMLGPAAVTSSRTAALKQVKTMLKQIRPSMRTAQARTATGLVKQHDAARKQLIMAHRNRARNETLADTRRAERDVTALRALGLAQGASLRAIAENLKRDKGRGEKEVARAVVAAAGGFTRRLEATDRVQRPRLIAAANDGLDAGDKQSRAAAEAIAASSENVTGQIQQTAADAGAALVTQANESSAEFDKLAQPVAKSIGGYLPPVGKAFDKKICCLNSAVTATGARVTAYMAGTKAPEAGGGACGDCGPKGAAPPAAKAPPEPAASMIPNEFIDMATKVGADPTIDAKLKDLADRAPVEIKSKMQVKSAGVWDNAGPLATHTEPLMAGLRSITARQGAAIKADFQDRFWRPGIEPYIRAYLPKLFSAGSTDTLNIDAAINYLNGNAIEGALNDLKAAVNYSNEELRVEAIQRSLTPEQWAELKRLHGDEIKDVRNDLDGVDQQVFDALDKEGDNFLASKGKPESDSTVGLGVAEADALRLRQKMGNDLKARGDRGADAASDSVKTAAGNAGNDVILGKDTLDLDDRAVAKDKAGFDDYDSVADRNKKQWERTRTAFDTIETADGKSKAPDGARAGWSIARFAAKERDYEETHGYGEDAYTVTVQDKIRDEQTQLIQTIVDFGPESEETAAARVRVEMTRAGGAKPERLQMAMLDGSLDAHEGEDRGKLAAQKDEHGKSEMDRRLESAKARQTRVLVLSDRLKRGEKLAPVDPSQPGAKPTPEQDRQDTATAARVREEMKVSLLTQNVSDPTAAKLNERTMREPAATWSAEMQERKQDAKAGFDHAIAHEDQRADTLKRTFGRMDKDEIRDAVGAWDAERKPGEKSLYAQLNLFGKGSWWTEKLSGDERTDVELAAKGIARNTEERALIARFRADQQIRDAGWLGKLAGKVTGDWDRLVESRDDIERQIGIPHAAFDAMGDAVNHGHFVDGELKPSPGGAAAQLEVAMRMTHLTTESYKAMTDRLATAVTTGLMIAAAVLTTALTGGAAASIWIPVLVTMGAGVVGMALSAAIKGQRYSRAEMERDLVMTFVQAATAGLGAAAGTAIKGGLPALRMVATEMKVAESVLENVARVSGTGLSKGWAMVAELGVAGASNTINNAAAAAMDPANRARGQSGEHALDAGLSSFLSGAFGSLLMKPAGALGGRTFGKIGERAIGNAANNMGTRGFEIYWQQRTGQRAPGQTADVTDEIISAGGQGLVQGALEHTAGHAADAYRARKGGSVVGHPGELATPHEQAVRPAHEETPAARHAAATQHEAPPTAAERLGPAPEHAPPPEPISLPVPAEFGPIVDAARPLRSETLPPIVHEATPPSNSSPPQSETPPQPGMGKAPDEEPKTLRKPPAGTEQAAGPHHQGPARPAPGEPEWASPEFMEGVVMMDANSNSRHEIDISYRNAIAADPSREVGIYRNPVTGEHIMVFGNQTEIFIGLNKHVGEAPYPAEPAGTRQDWKELLPADVGRWELEAHYHPGYNNNHDDAPMARRLPSTGQGGIGDFSVLEYESRAAGGTPRESVIHYSHGGQEGFTVFGHDPASADGKYWISVDNPATGQRETHRFATVADYETWAHGQGAAPNRDIPSIAPEVPPHGQPSGGTPPEPGGPVRPGAGASVESEPVDSATAAKNAAAKKAIEDRDQTLEKKAIDDFIARKNNPAGETAADKYQSRQAGQLDALWELERDIVERAIIGRMGSEQAAVANAAAHLAGLAAARGITVPEVPGMLRASHVEELMEARLRAGDSTEVAAAHAQALRELLRAPDEVLTDLKRRIAEGTSPGMIEFAATQARKKGGDILTGTELENARRNAGAEELGKFAKDFMAAGGGVRDFIAAARERSALTEPSLSPNDAVAAASAAELASRSSAALKADGEAAIAARVRRDAIKDYGRVAVGYETNPKRKGPKTPMPEREAYHILAGVNEPHLNDIIARSGRTPAENAELVREWIGARGREGLDRGVVAAQANLLKRVINNTAVHDYIEEKVAAHKALNITGDDLAAMIHKDPRLLALAHFDRAMLLERYASAMIKKGGGHVDAEVLSRHVETYMRSTGKGDIGEATLLAAVGQGDKYPIIFAGVAEAGRSNSPGIDMIAIEPRPFGPDAVVQDKVRVMLFDDKSLADFLLGKVSALTENLVTNLRKASAESEDSLAAWRERVTGLTSELGADHPAVKRDAAALADYQAAIDQMKAAADAIDAIPRKPGDVKANWKSPAYGKQVAAILEAHRIEMYVTSQYGGVRELGGVLKDYGFKMWDAQQEAAAPPPLPPPPVVPP